jgi:hypothetical protein
MSLPNGATALVRAIDVDGGGASKTGVLDAFDFTDVARTLEGISEGLRSALAKAAPDKVTVELAIELAAKAGKLTALLVDGADKGALTVTLEGDRGGAGRD